MSFDSLPPSILERYHIEEHWHALAILSVDCKEELQDILDCLHEFVLLRTEVEESGGRKTKITARVDNFLASRGWEERSIR